MRGPYSFLTLCLVLVSTACAQEKIIFEEDFNSDTLNMEIWNYEEGDGCPNLCGWGNNEKQIYNRDYVALEDGKLVITAEKKDDTYYSGKINSKDNVEFTYGVIEVKAKLATGKGLWPAIWMLGADISEVGWPASGEIDILEYIGKEPGIVFTSLHTPASHGNTINTKKTKVANIEEGYHTYKAVWTPDYIEFFVDGDQLYRFTPENYNEEEYPFKKDFYFLINMAVGGNLGGAEIDESALPDKFYVDHIKVTELPADY
ncbi:glycoside hydrolase family 16 protein [uncultured Christiangramia sp.]|uniref:glycoside hydrolase family 16 protein n=1 Tax=uncultured Christiangramia sp. TaxID=503836 RepID=UPI0025DB73CD|nr:glycoside hydrolase family 16 protein [uncultured Christiangramia sp.]|tara:strand:+ start:2951 stop:3727 length:777 start_codon:yes stop_codon:yes gene_type:complete